MAAAAVLFTTFKLQIFVLKMKIENLRTLFFCWGCSEILSKNEPRVLTKKK